MAEPFSAAALVPHAKIALAALLGGMVRLFLRPTRTVGSTVMLLTSCVTCGYFGQPVISYAMDLPARFDGAVGAILGLIGVSIAEGVLKGVDRLDFKTLLLRLIGQGGK